MVWQKLLGINLTKDKCILLVQNKSNEIYSTEIKGITIEITDLFYAWRDNKNINVNIDFENNWLLGASTKEFI